MKLEKLFFEKDGKIFDASDREVSLDGKICSVKWSDVESEVEVYNEDFLAKLRDELKEKEEKGEFVIIQPVVDKALTSENCEIFTAAMKHCARRIKDCVSVMGFFVPQELKSLGADKIDFYKEELLAKHKHYVFA